MTDLCLISFLFVGAGIMPFLARRIRVPSATLEIVLGFIVFNFIFAGLPQWFGFLKELGLIYLMFIAGMELEFTHLREKRKLCVYLLIAGGAFILNPIIASISGLPFFAGVAGAVMSAGIVIPILKEMDLLSSEFGRDAVVITITGEILSIAVLTMLDIYHQSGLTAGAILAVLKLSGMLVVSFLFLKLLYYFSWLYSEKVESVMESEDPVEEGLRAIVAIAFSGAMVAYLSGIEPILGSFITGGIFSYVYKSKGVFHEKINGLGFGFFIPLFFIGVGSELRPSMFLSPHILKNAVLFFTLPLIGHLPVLLLTLRKKGSLKSNLLVLLLSSAPLTMMVVAGDLGVRIGFLDETVKASVVIGAIVGSLLYPFLFRLIYQKYHTELLNGSVERVY